MRAKGARKGTAIRKPHKAKMAPRSVKGDRCVLVTSRSECTSNLPPRQNKNASTPREPQRPPAAEPSSWAYEKPGGGA